MTTEQQTQLVTSTVEAVDTTAEARGEQEVNTEEIMRMHARTFAWVCPRTGCDDRICFTGEQIEAVPFLIVRHLLRAHGLHPEGVAAAEPFLRDAVADYCKRMGLRR